MNLTEFIDENIFKKLDILEYKWDNYGKYCPGGTGLYLKHTDFHKIGQLLLNDGKYNNKQIISNEWIKEICSMQLDISFVNKDERLFQKKGIGYYTFISKNGYIFRDGANGQFLILNKEKDLLITILSTDSNLKDVAEILRDLI